MTEREYADLQKSIGVTATVERKPTPVLIFPTIDGTLRLPFTLCLPMPPRELWPNGRTHWRVKMRIIEDYKRECWMVARAACGKLTPIKGPLLVDLRFVFTPRHRRSDDDNLKASVKATIDSLSGLVWVDDRQVKIGTAEQVVESVPGLHEWVEMTIKAV